MKKTECWSVSDTCLQQVEQDVDSLGDHIQGFDAKIITSHYSTCLNVDGEIQHSFLAIYEYEWDEEDQ